jgi:hypothetical protein
MLELLLAFQLSTAPVTVEPQAIEKTKAVTKKDVVTTFGPKPKPGGIGF